MADTAETQAPAEDDMAATEAPAESSDGDDELSAEWESMVGEESGGQGGAAHERAFFQVDLHEGEPPTLKEVEAAYVDRVLKMTDGNKTRAARALGITFPTIAKKIADYGL